MSAKDHPEHCRTSCSDAAPLNADPEGSTGCARCTALLLDHQVLMREELVREAKRMRQRLMLRACITNEEWSQLAQRLEKLAELPEPEAPDEDEEDES